MRHKLIISLGLIGGLMGYHTFKNYAVSLPVYSPTPINVAVQLSSFHSLEQATHKQVNQYRRSRGLPPLRLDARISNEARQFSRKMALGKAPFNHNGFENRVKAIAQFIPLRSAGENLAFNQGYSDPVSVSVQGWIKSPGHRKNMEGDFNLTGIGIAQNAEGKYYFTQIFVKTR